MQKKNIFIIFQNHIKLHLNPRSQEGLAAEERKWITGYLSTPSDKQSWYQGKSEALASGTK